ncbi:hypothetical protein HX13_21970 [Chryseobacterium sp. P1-3]|nr:hypothetical protein HX13_21970 [Chryseobacterium sp. P1-3]
MGKLVLLLALALSTNLHPFNIPQVQPRFKAGAHFSLFRVVEAWAKRYFSVLVLGWEDSGALEAEHFV